MNTTYYYTLLLIFSVVMFMIIVDPNVGAWIDLKIKHLGLEIKRRYYMIIWHPENPILRWQIERRSKEMAESLRKELIENGKIKE